MSTIMQHQVACNATVSLVTFYATLSNENLQLKKLGNWVKKHREMMNFSQETAAEKVGLSRYQWIRIENGQSGTKRETIISIAKELKADETEGLTLLAGLEPQNAKKEPQTKIEELAFHYPGIPEQKRDKVDYLIDLLEGEIKKIEAEKLKYGEE